MPWGLDFWIGCLFAHGSPFCHALESAHGTNFLASRLTPSSLNLKKICITMNSSLEHTDATRIDGEKGPGPRECVCARTPAQSELSHCRARRLMFTAPCDVFLSLTRNRGTGFPLRSFCLCFLQDGGRKLSIKKYLFAGGQAKRQWLLDTFFNVCLLIDRAPRADSS